MYVDPDMLILRDLNDMLSSLDGTEFALGAIQAGRKKFYKTYLNFEDPLIKYLFLHTPTYLHITSLADGTHELSVSCSVMDLWTLQKLYCYRFHPHFSLFLQCILKYLHLFFLFCRERFDPEEAAFNAGVLVMDFERWRQQNITQELEWWMEKVSRISSLKTTSL